MKKFSYLLLGAMAFSLASCGGEESAWQKIEYFPYQEKENGNWGMISTDGEVLFSEEFKEAKYPTVVVNDRFFVKKQKDSDTYWEIYSADESPKQVGSDTYAQIAAFYEDVTPAVKKDDYIYLINKDGEPQGEALKKLDGKDVFSVSEFKEGLAIVTVKSNDDEYLMGAIDTDGEMVIAPEYYHLEKCNDGKLFGINKKFKDEENLADMEITVLDDGGDIISTFKIKEAVNCSGYYVDGVMAVAVENGDATEWGLIDEKGEWVLKASDKVGIIKDMQDGKFIYTDEDGYGLKNFDGEDLIDSGKFDELTFLSDDILAAKENNNNGKSKWFLVNTDGEKIGDAEFLDKPSKFFNSGLAIARTGKKSYSFINEDGEIEELENVNIYSWSGEFGDDTVYTKKN